MNKAVSLLVCTVWFLSCPLQAGESEGNKKVANAKKNTRERSVVRVGLYVNDPRASIKRLIRCLEEWKLDYVKIQRKDLVRIDEFDIDVLLLHGGWYGIDRVPSQDQYKFETTPELKQRGDAVREFVRKGGGIVGVCAGAYNIVWMDLIKADISRMSGIAVNSMETVNGRHPIVRGVPVKSKRKHRTWEPLPVVRFNGPILLPKDKRTMVFSYDWEQRLGAILADSYGKGRAVGISPHPERTAHDLGTRMRPKEPLMRVAGVLKNALIWAGCGQTE